MSTSDLSYFRNLVSARGIVCGQLWEEIRTGDIWKVVDVVEACFIVRRDDAELRVVTPDLIDPFLLACKELVSN